MLELFTPKYTQFRYLLILKTSSSLVSIPNILKAALPKIVSYLDFMSNVGGSGNKATFYLIDGVVSIKVDYLNFSALELTDCLIYASLNSD